MIRFEHVCRTFEGRRVLDNINLQLREGKIYVLKGISGSGKTTLLNRILKNEKGYKFAVIVNDIGEVNIVYVAEKCSYIRSFCL